MSDPSPPSSALMKELAKSNKNLAKQVGELTTAVKSMTAAMNTGFASLAKEFVAANAAAAQHGASFTGIAEDLAKMHSILDKSHSSSSTMSQATNPHSQSLNLGTSGGIKGWLHGVSLPKDMESLTLTVGPDAQKSFRTVLDYLKYNGYGTLFNIPTGGTGLPGLHPIVTGTGTRADTNLTDCKDIVSKTVNLERDNVLKFAGYIHGGNKDGYAIPTKRVQKILDFQAGGNEGKVAHFKQQLRIRCEMLMAVWRRIIDPTSLESYLAQKDIFVWTKEEDGSEFYCGLTILWLMLETIEPKTVIDAQRFEKIIESTSLKDTCGNDVRKYLSALQNARDELTVRHGTARMSDDKFLGHVFSGLSEVTQETFKLFVTQQRTEWMTNPPFDIPLFLKKLDNLYSSLLTEGAWNKPPPEDKKVLALTSQIRSLQSDNKRLKKEAAASSSGGDNSSTKKGGEQKVDGIEPWRKVKIGDKITRDGKTYFWCNEHARGNGLYMSQNANDPPRHDHAAWLEKKQHLNKGRKNKRKGKDEDDASTGTTSSTKSSSVKKKLKVRREKQVNALVTECNLDHPTAELYWAKMNEESGYSDGESSKE